MNIVGPEAIQARMEEINARIRSLSPRPQRDFDARFKNELASKKPAPLTGSIGDENVRPAGVNADVLREVLSESTGSHQQEYKTMAMEAATRHGIRPELFMSLVNTESSWDPSVVSDHKAAGLSQLMPDTASEMGVIDVFDPRQNLEGGARYLRKLLTRYSGNERDALAAYNWGPSKYDRANRQAPITVNAYVNKVLRGTQQP